MEIVKTDSQHYADIAAAIRTKSGGTAQYKPREMSSAILGLESGSQESSILVYAPTGSQITLTCGDTVRTVPENGGLWRFDNCALGSWVVTASLDGMTEVYPVEIQEEGQMMRYEIHVTYAKIFGIARDITSTSPEWTRTDDAVGKTATASVGTVTGHSDFDGEYPWCDICRETVSTGDVMVKIPKFWYKRYREGNMEHIKISDHAMNGFKLHPAFFHGGVEQSAFYVGAYKTNSSTTSASGALPGTNETVGSFRDKAKAKGTGWGLLDISSLSALQMLFLVEFANFNSQTAVGYGYGKASTSDSKMSCGSTDGVPNLTGVPAGTLGKVDVVWRGIEGLWGNTYHYIDGILTVDDYYYVCNDPSKYSDSLNAYYSQLDFSIGAKGLAYRYITKQCCLTGDLDYLFLPQEAGNGSASTYVCDCTSSSDSGTHIMRHGGRWYNNDYVGLFMSDFTNDATAAYAYNGSRLLYIPQEVNP